MFFLPLNTAIFSAFSNSESLDFIRFLVEAGGVEPTVRRKDHRNFSERRLRFEFRAVGGRSRPPRELSR